MRYHGELRRASTTHIAVKKSNGPRAVAAMEQDQRWTAAPYPPHHSASPQERLVALRLGRHALDDGDGLIAD